MDPIERLRQTVGAISGMSPEDFDLSLGHWQQKIYKFHDQTGVEKKTSPAWQRFGRIFAESVSENVWPVPHEPHGPSLTNRTAGPT